ncbi:hypothetical protein LQ567_03910 [Niabella pedocola]|uniref:Uncharacterized protein n=1 Tax=Niabella pedocola TaxID=1752077 RepID=A0ABS8PLC4_9BACT|nr:hypothetical protein [Niabella pedocola]MCD2421893.1 hypothetical protein [Niabella pedocola]
MNRNVRKGFARSLAGMFSLRSLRVRCALAVKNKPQCAQGFRRLLARKFFSRSLRMRCALAVKNEPQCTQGFRKVIGRDVFLAIIAGALRLSGKE